MIATAPLSLSEEKELSLFQLLDPQVLANPHPFYARLRAADPVHWDRFQHSWVVTSYAECQVVLTKFKAARTPTSAGMDAMGLGILGPYADMMLKQILFMDAPGHTRIRSLCAVAFTPRRVGILRDAIQTIADQLIDRFAPAGRADLLAGFASPFPALMLTALLGLPSADAPRLHRWAADFGELIGNFEHDPDRIDSLSSSLQDFKQYVTNQALLQQTEPLDGLISTLLTADINGERLSFDEVVANSILMVGGGLEELANLIANGMLTLLNFPAQLALLRDNPSLMPSAIEELLRFECTTQYTGRIAPEDTLLGGKPVRKGDAVTAVLAAANRDPARFPDPENLDLTRADNRHLAFSYAAHYCLGAPLVRLSAAIAFATLLRRLPALALTSARPRWRGMAAMRSLHELPVTFTPPPC